MASEAVQAAPLPRRAVFILFLCCWLGLCPPTRAQSRTPTAQSKRSTTETKTPTVDAAGHQWWQNAVFYEIYPRSFADSNNDGIGDLNGIASKLDYLKQLGVDAVWITPCFPSPQVDFGYDVSDYEDIDPMYGTLSDFDQFESAARAHGIRIILDLVVNHTSEQHPWFIDSRSSRTSKHRDWYIWRDGRSTPTSATAALVGGPGGPNPIAAAAKPAATGGPGQPPNNWESLFGGTAWQFDSRTRQYYYHFFFPQQPDLNWRNPAVKDAMFDVTRWWYDRGVAGFRLDAVDALFENSDLRDNPVLPGRNAYGDPNMQDRYNRNLPELHGVLQGLRQVADRYDAVLIGETWTDNIGQLDRYYGQNGNELQMPMDFMFTTVKRLSPPEFRRQIAAVNAAAGWPVYVIGNHDIVRSYVRYGDGQHDDAIAKVMAGLYLTLRGTPIMYYGEEIGMQNNDPKYRKDVKDPIGKLGWPKEKGRDGERTPMQWDDTLNAGFSRTRPWLPVADNYRTHNVASEEKDPNSVLVFYRHLLALRHTNPALLDGDYVALNESDPNVMAYLRRYRDQAVLVVLNMSASPQKVEFNLATQGFPASQARTLLTTMPALEGTTGISQMSLAPFSVYIGEVTRTAAPATQARTGEAEKP
ncbi:MAG TPA: alpha-glucosidase [Candidatus Binatia bacterium]|nr:alpha-glucosidase [Candidatus Binatia bacterium]